MAKLRTWRALGNRTLIADSAETAFCKRKAPIFCCSQGASFIDGP